MCRAVVLFQFDDLRAGIILFEIEDVGDIRAAPTVDGLVLIADHANVVMVSDEQSQQAVLAVVGVLVFIHENVFELVPVFLSDVLMSGQKLDRVKNQIIEIERAAVFESPFVAGVHFGGAGFEIPGSFLREIGCGFHAVFGR